MQELSLMVIDEGQQYGTDREIAVISLMRQQPLVLWTGDSEQTPGGIDRAARNAKRSRQLLLSKKHGLRSDRNYYMPANLADYPQTNPPPRPAHVRSAMDKPTLATSYGRP